MIYNKVMKSNTVLVIIAKTVATGLVLSASTGSSFANKKIHPKMTKTIQPSQEQVQEITTTHQDRPLRIQLKIVPITN